MKERSLEHCFNGTKTAENLAEDLKITQQRASLDVRNYHIEGLYEDGEYEMTPGLIIKLCDETLNGQLQLENLNSIAFALNSSDYFTWDE